MRKFILIVVAAVVVLVGGLAIYLHSFDFGPYRGLVARQVQGLTGRELDIAGEVRLRVFSLNPAVVVEDVRFANAAWGTRPEMAKIRRLEAKVSLLRLLTGALEVERVILVEPDILFETNESDVGNWLMAGAEPAAKTEEGASESGPALPTVRLIQMDDATVSYRDGQTGRTRTLTIARIVGRSDGPERPMELTFSGDLDGTPVFVNAVLGSLMELLEGEQPWPVVVAAEIGTNKLSGKGGLELGRTPARARLALEAPELDLAQFADAEKDSGRLFTEEPLLLSALRAFDAELSLKIGRLAGAGPVLKNLEARAAIKDGRLALKPVTAEAGDGQLKAELDLEAQGGVGVLAAIMSLRDAKLDVITREALGDDTLTGALDVDAKIDGRGLSIAAIMGGLNGHVTAISGKGRLRNEFFNFLSADVLTAVNPLAPAQQPQQVLCSVGRFDIRDGKAVSRVTLLDTTRATVVGEGGIDLKSEKIDMLFTPSTKDTSLLSVAALVPVRLTGSLADPVVLPDPVQAAAGVAKTAVGKVVDTAENVGSLLGIGSGAKSRGSPCAKAISIARAGVAPAGGAAPVGEATRQAAPAPKKKEGVLDKLKKIIE